VASGTLATIAGTVSKVTATTAGVRFTTDAEIRLTAGVKKTLTFNVTTIETEVAYAPALGFKDPIIYLREMPGITIDETSIKVIKG
jgi:hypothetical protein